MREKEQRSKAQLYADYARTLAEFRDSWRGLRAHLEVEPGRMVGPVIVLDRLFDFLYSELEQMELGVDIAERTKKQGRRP